MHIFVWKIWIPLMKLVHPYDRELFNEVDHSASVFHQHSRFLFKFYPLPFNDMVPSLGVQVASLFLNLVTETNSWEVLEATIVPLLLRSIGSSLGVIQSDQFSIYKWGENSISNRLISQYLYRVTC